METLEKGINKIRISDFGEVEGKPIQKYVIDIEAGIKASLINYGGILTSLMTPDREGTYADVVIGFNELGSYVRDQHAIGSLVGRFANRIDQGRIQIDGKTYQLELNHGDHHLHGGTMGFGKVVWDILSAEEVDDGIEIVLRYVSTNGEGGYPGELNIEVTYRFFNDSFSIRYGAKSSTSTYINPTHHAYFNLSGDFDSNVLDNELCIGATRYLPTRKDQIPTGELATVESTPFDFTRPKRIGDLMDLKNDQLAIGNGYDHTFVLDKGVTTEPELSATVYHRGSGRYMEVLTTEPGIQLYTGNYLSELIEEKHGSPLVKHGGLCLETQHFPDSPNHDHFPSTLLNKGEVFDSTTIYRFKTT